MGKPKKTFVDRSRNAFPRRLKHPVDGRLSKSVLARDNLLYGQPTKNEILNEESYTMLYMGGIK